MGRLINPGLGDYLDRLAVLELKVQHAPDGAAEHFRRERAAVLGKLSAQFGQAQLEAYTTLLVLNARIWACEDEMAGWAAAVDMPSRELPTSVATLGILIWRLNRARSQTVDALNKLAGDDRGPEKV